MSLRAALWAAVSTTAQATEDKVSIKDQIKKGHEVIKHNGWVLAGEYILPGESRTSHISLSHAERDIPQLHQLLEDASARKFDIIYIYDLNRFRNLMMQIFETMCDYGVQFYNYADPIQPVKPAEYTPERQNAIRLNIKIHDILSGQEINTLKKLYRDRMPARVTEKGLHAGVGGPPYGYRKVHPLDRHTPLVIEPSESRVLIQMKDWLFAGLSMNQIVARLNEMSVPTKTGGRWFVGTIRHMLKNPYYAGIVSWGVEQTIRDRRNTTKKTILKNPNPIYARGKHIPIWDEATHQRILDIIKQRGQAFAGNRTKRFTSLLRCWCGSVLHIKYSTAGKLLWHCSSRQPKHIRIKDEEVIAIAIPKIVAEIRSAPGITIPQEEQNKTETLLNEIRELQKKERRWIELFESEQEPTPSIKTRLKEITNQLSAAHAQLAKQKSLAHTRENTHNAILQLQQLLDTLPVYYTEADPIQVNADLRTIIDYITITKERECQITWKT
jgi:hypothetical protein